MTAAAKRIVDHPARPLLSGVLYALDQAGSDPSPELIRQVRAQVQSAYDLLGVRDELAERAGFVLVGIKQSTQIDETVGLGGHTIERVRITDRDLYMFTMKRLHNLLPEVA